MMCISGWWMALGPGGNNHASFSGCPLTLTAGVFFFFVLITLEPTTQAHAKQFFEDANDKEILDFLLHKSNYDKRIKPESLEALKVNVSVLLLSLSSPDESSLKYEVEFLLRQFWVDPRLVHDDKGRFRYLSGMHHLDDIWLPDTLFLKHGDFKEPELPDHVALKIYRNGTVDYMRRRHLIISCEGDLNIFPFDDPYCTFAIESMTHEKKEIEFSWCNDTGTQNGTQLKKTSQMRSLNAYMISNETRTCRDDYQWRGNYSCLRVDLRFTRDDAFYFSTIFIPGIILVTSSFITFWLEWNAVPARVLIGVTTMLNFFTTSNSFRSTLPVVSNLSAMNLWDSVCMFFIYVSLLEFVLVNYIGRKRAKHNMAYTPGENAVIQRIPEAIHRIGMSLFPAVQVRGRGGSNGGVRSSSLDDDNRNFHELSTYGNCDTDRASLSGQDGAANNFVNGEVRPKELGADIIVNEEQENLEAPVSIASKEPIERSQVEYTFQHSSSKIPAHPIRVAKSIDVISRVVFPIGYAVFLVYFFASYKGLP